MLSVDRIDVHVEDGMHPLDVRYGSEIEAYWRQLSAANPALFNGEYYLTVEKQIEGRVLKGTYRRTHFATFLYWRDHVTSIKGAFQIISIAAMVSSDNKIIMGKMSADSANAGRIYIPAGSVSDEDIRDGVVDFDTAMTRETFEETGIQLRLDQANDCYTLCETRGVVALIREFQTGMHSTELVAKIEDNLTQQLERELECVYAYGRGETHPTMPEFLKHYQNNRS